MTNLINPVDGDEWSYYDTEEGLFIFDYRGKDKNAVIPAFIGGKPVKAVLGTGQYLCYRWGIFYKKGVESLVISEGITTIMDDEFAWGDLARVRIPSIVTYIGPSVFMRNELAGINLPGIVTGIGGRAFSENRLAGVFIPRTLVSYPAARGTVCAIPPGVKRIASFAFARNELVRIIIGMDVELFYYNEFEDDFSSAYKRGGKKAGKYTKSGDAWNYAPLDKELASGYRKTIARAKAKRAASVVKKTARMTLLVFGSVPLTLLFLPGILI
jgi:hypothetical protein